jgi:O-antigen/teichoic acid export membrane protein
MLGVGQVSIYSISFRLFAIFYACVTLINGVLIPMYGKLSSVSDWGEIRRILKLQITLMPIIAGLVWIDGILLAKEAISLWLNRNDMFGGYLLVFSLGGYGYILSYVSVFSSTLTALNQASTLARLAWLEAILNLAFSLFLVTYFGVGGVAMGTMLAALFCPMVMLRSRINSYNGGVLRLSYKDSSKHFILILLPSVVIALIISDYSKMLVVKMALAILLNGGYIYLSWKIIPAEVKSFISSQSGFLAK